MYAGGALGAALVIAVAVYFLVFYQAPSCFDLAQNGRETGIDCGGSCEKVCAAEAIPPAVVWSRAFEVAPGVWTAAAYVENKNVDAGVRSLPYRFKFFEEGGVLIAERRGSTFLAPHSIAVIVEPSVSVGKRIPTRTQFDFEALPDWEEIREEMVPSLDVGGIVLERADTLPRVTAAVRNSSNRIVKEIEATALLLDGEENVVGASKTIIPALSREEVKETVFTWPKPFSQDILRVDVRARALFLTEKL